MAIKQLSYTVTGIDSLLINNPQTSDPLNVYAKEMKYYTNKKKRTDDDIIAMRELEIRAKIYWDDSIGIYVPSTWATAAIQGVSWVKAKVKKADIRAAVFATKPKLKLTYEGINLIKEPIDIVKNPDFHNVISMKQGQVRVVKATPKFGKWSFTVDLDYDDSIINERELKELIEYSAAFGGFGDFRPTYGRATINWL